MYVAFANFDSMYINFAKLTFSVMPVDNMQIIDSALKLHFACKSFQRCPWQYCHILIIRLLCFEILASIYF